MALQSYVIVLDVPDGVSKDEVINYITTALTCERGMREPQDPMFEFDPGSLVIQQKD